MPNLIDFRRTRTTPAVVNPTLNAGAPGTMRGRYGVKPSEKLRLPEFGACYRFSCDDRREVKISNDRVIAAAGRAAGRRFSSKELDDLMPFLDAYRCVLRSVRPANVSAFHASVLAHVARYFCNAGPYMAFVAAAATEGDSAVDRYEGGWDGLVRHAASSSELVFSFAGSDDDEPADEGDDDKDEDVQSVLSASFTEAGESAAAEAAAAAARRRLAEEDAAAPSLPSAPAPDALFGDPVAPTRPDVGDREPAAAPAAPAGELLWRSGDRAASLNTDKRGAHRRTLPLEVYVGRPRLRLPPPKGDERVKFHGANVLRIAGGDSCNHPNTRVDFSMALNAALTHATSFLRGHVNVHVVVHNFKFVDMARYAPDYTASYDCAYPCVSCANAMRSAPGASFAMAGWGSTGSRATVECSCDVYGLDAMCSRCKAPVHVVINRGEPCRRVVERAFNVDAAALVVVVMPVVFDDKDTRHYVDDSGVAEFTGTRRVSSPEEKKLYGAPVTVDVHTDAPVGSIPLVTVHTTVALENGVAVRSVVKDFGAYIVVGYHRMPEATVFRPPREPRVVVLAAAAPRTITRDGTIVELAGHGDVLLDHETAAVFTRTTVNNAASMQRLAAAIRRATPSVRPEEVDALVATAVDTKLVSSAHDATVLCSAAESDLGAVAYQAATVHKPLAGALGYVSRAAKQFGAAVGSALRQEDQRLADGKDCLTERVICAAASGVAAVASVAERVAADAGPAMPTTSLRGTVAAPPPDGWNSDDSGGDERITAARRRVLRAARTESLHDLPPPSDPPRPAADVPIPTALGGARAWPSRVIRPAARRVATSARAASAALRAAAGTAVDAAGGAAQSVRRHETVAAIAQSAQTPGSPVVQFGVAFTAYMMFSLFVAVYNDLEWTTFHGVLTAPYRAWYNDAKWYDSILLWAADMPVLKKVVSIGRIVKAMHAWAFFVAVLVASLSGCALYIENFPQHEAAYAIIVAPVIEETLVALMWVFRPAILVFEVYPMWVAGRSGPAKRKLFVHCLLWALSTFAAPIVALVVHIAYNSYCWAQFNRAGRLSDRHHTAAPMFCGTTNSAAADMFAESGSPELSDALGALDGNAGSRSGL